MSKENNIESESDLQEIDLVSLIKTLVNKKKTIYRLLFIFMVIGLFLAVFTPKEYTGSTIFVPQGTDGKKSGGLGGLAALAGINIGGGAGDSGIPLNLYPEIINSIPFQKELVKTPLTIKGQESKITYKEYYDSVYNPGFLFHLKKYTIGLPGFLINKFKGEAKDNVQSKVDSDSIFHITFKEKKLFDQLKSQISLSVDRNDNFITLKAKMPEAISAAELTYSAEKILEKYIIDYKIKKSSEKLSFINKRFSEKKKVFLEKQQQLASFQDRNRYSNSARSQSRLTSLQSEFDLAYNIYNELAQQIETQKIQVKEDTPIFTVIKPVSVPMEKSAPNKLSIFLVWTFFGFFLGIVLVFGREFYNNYKLKN
ncbi:MULTISPECIES: Wzz/FepE/Etk N-terminal domain-containing protein [Tenacibaculum]|uniref:Wzz/FepE/Etk N-terminal domain-containing protein n=1 Tax=Tenacibaculum TaxID=104267 RepID=UPI001F0A3215|nr:MULTISPECIES: Wzz/FepE/Etk N-terminal domain-containing protein [Tenacibaculum]MCH3883128.1 Wzz/FepE/Etk N-terminal domain-containing protein [Tenacibaculum aquimarinum]MDO6600865.1 Wzz/FepE/Etk N-terminal domain-containing protein [Tenacibaculum sp. 1_MG-2023]